ARPGLPWASLKKDREDAIPPGFSAGFEDGLSDEAHGLCCQPLEVGLASEARSTTGALAKSGERNASRAILLFVLRQHRAELFFA
ncbi:MAG: hypothetical protein WBZ19_08645, partial [Chthoniobacterales bacterium]